MDLVARRRRAAARKPGAGDRLTATSRPPRTPADRVRLYQMRAERVMAALPAGTVSILITDPPYTTVDQRPDGAHLRRWFPGGLSWPEIARILGTARRKLRPDGVAFVMTNGDGLRDALAAMARAGFVRVRTVTWDRRWPGLGGGLRHQTEFVLVGYLPGSRTLTGTDLVSVAAVGPATTGRWVTEKPEALGRELAAIAGIGPGDIVLDPFCGSGALLVAARERGAAVIGADIAAAAIRRATGKLMVPAARPRRSPGPASGGRGRPTVHRRA